jgi:hypothetical protein
LSGCKYCQQFPKICEQSGCFIDPESCTTNFESCTKTGKINGSCNNKVDQCWCPSTPSPSGTPSSSPSSSPSPSPTPSTSCGCRDDLTVDCYSNCPDCNALCLYFPPGSCSCTGGVPLGICPGQNITCCCASFSTPPPPTLTPSGSPSPSPSCCGVNCCKDPNLANVIASLNINSQGCAQCTFNPPEDVADDCDPKKCAKTKCYSGFCKSLGSSIKTVGVVIVRGGGVRCSVSNSCTAATSQTVGGVCNGTYPPVPGDSEPIGC